MKRFLCLALAGFVAFSGSVIAGEDAKLDSSSSKALKAAINGKHRSDANKARDKYRNPYETLQFFGVTQDMTVVEISPGGGAWYMEVLAPYLGKKGTYYAASYDQASESDYVKRNMKRFNDKIAAHPKAYKNVKVTEFSPRSGKSTIAPAGSADAVLTFRNVHNWMGGEYSEQAFKAFYDALKPGGILGLVEHRANTDKPQDPKAESGYVREDYVIAMAEKAGFKLVAKSEVNANAKDDRDPSPCTRHQKR